MRRPKRNSTYNRKDSSRKEPLQVVKASSLILIILLLIISSQSFLSSYPVAVLINNNTKFTGTFDQITDNKIIISANQIPITPGDVIAIKNDGYLKFINITSSGDIEAYKYNTYKLHQNILFSQNIYTWNTLNPISLETGSSIINLTKLPNTILVETPLSRYELILFSNSFTFITTDDNEFLYKLSSVENNIIITAIGVYNNIPFNINEYTYSQ